MEATMPWKIRGHDTFEDAPYRLEGKYGSQDAAEEGARSRLEYLEKNQPTESSGGQADDGIQDRVFVVRPDGTEYRYTPAEPTEGTKCRVIMKETAGNIMVETEDGRKVEVETELPNVQIGDTGTLFTHEGIPAFLREP